MKATCTLNTAEQELTLIIDWKVGNTENPLSATESETVVKYLGDAANDATRQAFKQWLLQFESCADTLEVNGLTYRFKMVSEKEFLTKFGHITIPRRIYQQDAGGLIYVPLDEAWNMQGQFAALEVRETLLFLSAHLSPGDTIACLEKTASFICSKTTVQNVVDDMGAYLEKHEDALLGTVREREDLPIEKTKCVAFSMDGANVRLNIPGSKKGRPTERPKDEASMGRETASCYKNVMCGAASFYGEVLENTGSSGKTPERFAARYVARMPEETFPTFRKKFEAEVHSSLDKLPPDVVKIVINDGGTNLWNYVDAEPLYKDFEKIVDFHHVMEHVSSGAEGIFGKGTSDGQAWYRKMEAHLLSYEDGATRVIRSLEYFLQSYEYPETSCKLIDGCLTFMRNNDHRMEYKRFRDRGYPIGSGPVEGACKNLVKKRMCQSGQRWSIRGGQAVLSIRTIVKSARWEHFWSAYKKHSDAPKMEQAA